MSVTEIVWRRMLEEIVSNESVKTHKETVVADFDILQRHSHGGTEESQEVSVTIVSLLAEV
jgi:hypothetical protein